MRGDCPVTEKSGVFVEKMSADLVVQPIRTRALNLTRTLRDRNKASLPITAVERNAGLLGPKGQ